MFYIQDSYHASYNTSWMHISSGVTPSEVTPSERVKSCGEHAGQQRRSLQILRSFRANIDAGSIK